MTNFVKYTGPVVVAGVSVEISEKGRVVLCGPDRPTEERLDFLPYNSVRVACGKAELESNACHQQEEAAEFLRLFAARVVREAAAVREAAPDVAELRTLGRSWWVAKYPRTLARDAVEMVERQKKLEAAEKALTEAYERLVSERERVLVAAGSDGCCCCANRPDAVSWCFATFGERPERWEGP